VNRQSLLSLQFSRLCERHGVDGKSFHCLRHTFVTELRRQGKSFADIAELVGHSSIEMTKGYAH
jgi:integrase